MLLEAKDSELVSVSRCLVIQGPRRSFKSTSYHSWYQRSRGDCQDAWGLGGRTTIYSKRIVVGMCGLLSLWTLSFYEFVPASFAPWMGVSSFWARQLATNMGLPIRDGFEAPWNILYGSSGQAKMVAIVRFLYRELFKCVVHAVCLVQLWPAFNYCFLCNNFLW